jgi:hypothetical protein
MASKVLASGPRLDLYRVDLLQVVNKRIGETESNFWPRRRYFEAIPNRCRTPVGLPGSHGLPQTPQPARYSPSGMSEDS